MYASNIRPHQRHPLHVPTAGVLSSMWSLAFYACKIQHYTVSMHRDWLGVKRAKGLPACFPLNNYPRTFYTCRAARLIPTTSVFKKSCTRRVRDIICAPLVAARDLTFEPGAQNSPLASRSGWMAKSEGCGFSCCCCWRLGSNQPTPASIFHSLLVSIVIWFWLARVDGTFLCIRAHSSNGGFNRQRTRAKEAVYTKYNSMNREVLARASSRVCVCAISDWIAWFDG